MSTVLWPAGVCPLSADYAIEFDVQIKVARSGRVYTHGLPGARWVAAITFVQEVGDDYEQDRPRIEAMLAAMKGGANVLSMPHFGRPIPRGTMRGAPVLQQPSVVGSDVLHLSNVGGTLLDGDIIGIGGQLFMVLGDAAPNAGAMAVRVAPSPRRIYTAGTPVEWRAPETLWVPRSSTAGPFPYQPLLRPGFSAEFVEAA